MIASVACISIFTLIAMLLLFALLQLPLDVAFAVGVAFAIAQRDADNLIFVFFLSYFIKKNIQIIPLITNNYHFFSLWILIGCNWIDLCLTEMSLEVTLLSKYRCQFNFTHIFV